MRLRSVPLKLDKLLPRRAAILSKRISSEMGPSKAFVVFKEEASVAAALELNMQEVDPSSHTREAHPRDPLFLYAHHARKNGLYSIPLQQEKQA